ncbi:hypothetical protein QYS46_14685 [Klebsiella michiganensis]|nr:hypothetical protein [Klebsiella michiganensis]
MKTTKSKKTQYNGEITMIEFLKANSDLTTREIANALGRGMSSVNGTSFASCMERVRLSRAAYATAQPCGALTTCRLAVRTVFA